MAKNKKKQKNWDDQTITLEPYEIREWFALCAKAAAGELEAIPNLVWHVTAIGTMWPHKVVRDA